MSTFETSRNSPHGLLVINHFFLIIKLLHSKSELLTEMQTLNASEKCHLKNLLVKQFQYYSYKFLSWLLTVDYHLIFIMKPEYTKYKGREHLKKSVPRNENKPMQSRACKAEKSCSVPCSINSMNWGATTNQALPWALRMPTTGTRISPGDIQR